MDSKRQLAAIMFTDIVGYTLMMQEDRQAAISAAKQHEDAVSRSAAQHNGEVINFYGDGSLTLFDTATAAINCAREIQVDLVKKVALRIGIHDGEVVVEDGKAYGDGVNIASRIEGSGHAGVILFSKSIRDKIKNDNSFQFEALGLFRFKNVTNPVELFGLTDKELPVIERSKLRNRVKSRFGIKATATFIGLGLILLLAMVLGNGYLGSRQFDNYTELSIAVMPFENYTLDPELDVVGQMASHWITNGLIDGSRARMVSYDAVHAQGQVLIAGVGSKKSFAQTIGADRTIEGSFAIIGSQHDSLVFTASLNDPGTGERIQGFSEQVCDRKVPLEAIKALLAIIKGFWESQDSKVLSPPKYEAYQAYLTARDLWMEDDQEALHQLNLAIGIDSSFLDPYFL
ncbi:MAG: adenylate/guanylate cyclase domain-containing protein, partial [Saprospiraceae bacterium]|nr:adenylate/guanylate cyclase domain-containing protein [Saprospiraceae bacterium]